MLKRLGQFAFYIIIVLLAVLANNYISSSSEGSWVRIVPFMLGAILVVFLVAWLAISRVRTMYLDWRKRQDDDPS